MTEIKVNYAALVAASNDIKATAMAIDTQLKDLKGFLAPLVATWTGAAADTYQVKQGMWTAAQTDQQAVLLHMSQIVLHAHDGYQEVDGRVGRAWRV